MYAGEREDMTQKRWLPIRSKSGYIYGGIAFFLLFILLLLLRNPSLAIEQVKAGITLCSQVIIPSLFPFLVLSELFLLCGIDRYAATMLGRSVIWALRLPGKYAPYSAARSSADSIFAILSEEQYEG